MVLLLFDTCLVSVRFYVMRASVGLARVAFVWCFCFAVSVVYMCIFLRLQILGLSVTSLELEGSLTTKTNDGPALSRLCVVDAFSEDLILSLHLLYSLMYKQHRNAALTQVCRNELFSTR